MKHAFVLLCLGFVLCSCATQKIETESERRAKYDLIDKHIAAKKNSVVACTEPMQCKRMFDMAKVFIQEKSDMRIQVMDDTIVSTYGVTQPYYCGMVAKKTPETGGNAKISLDIECYDLSDSIVSLARKIDLYEKFGKALRSLQ